MTHKLLKIKILLLATVIMVWPLYVFAQSGGVQELQQEIQARQKQIEELQNKQKEYEQQITTYRQQASNLNAQVNALNSQITRTQLKQHSTELQIEETELKIEQTNANINLKETEINAQKDRLKNIFIAMYKQDQRDNIVELIIGSGGLGDAFTELAEFQRIHTTLKGQLNGLEQLRTQLEAQKQELIKQNDQLSGYKDELDNQSARLSRDQYAKQVILDQTKGNQKKYESLLAKLKAEVAQINNEINSFEQRLRQQLGQKGQLQSVGKLQWPVPSRVITSYFHDPDYPYRQVFEHPAIDVKAAHGTPVHAAADGYVGRVKDGGRYGYSYILLVHGDNISTVYGHLSRMIAVPDSFVTAGQIIGYSGGTPGTPGAGNMTTGPHLHFEVRLNGIPVDPLDYL